MKEGDSWADRLRGTRGKTESSRSVIETVEKKERKTAATVLTAHYYQPARLRNPAV